MLLNELSCRVHLGPKQTNVFILTKQRFRSSYQTTFQRKKDIKITTKHRSENGKLSCQTGYFTVKYVENLFLTSVAGTGFVVLITAHIHERVGCSRQMSPVFGWRRPRGHRCTITLLKLSCVQGEGLT